MILKCEKCDCTLSLEDAVVLCPEDFKILKNKIDELESIIKNPCHLKSENYDHKFVLFKNGVVRCQKCGVINHGSLITSFEPAIE